MEKVFFHLYVIFHCFTDQCFSSALVSCATPAIPNSFRYVELVPYTIVTSSQICSQWSKCSSIGTWPVPVIQNPQPQPPRHFLKIYRMSLISAGSISLDSTFKSLIFSPYVSIFPNKFQILIKHILSMRGTTFSLYSV